MKSFEHDQYPGKPKILFVGIGESTHTQAWIDLLKEAEFNVRLFSLPTGVPPNAWWARTYSTVYGQPATDSETRVGFFNKGRPRRVFERSVARLKKIPWTAEEKFLEWLTEIVRSWRPDVVHTLGLEPAGFLFARVRKNDGVAGIGKWIAQVRGGPDLALHRLLPEYDERIRDVLTQCDRLIADNQQNYEYALALGLKEQQVAEIGVVPGTGGVDVETLAANWLDKPSHRRGIVWPKAYECPQSTALPVMEALRLAWNRLPPCEVHMLGAEAVQPTVRMWFHTLPAEIRERCSLVDRVSREQTMQWLTAARVMLAPALADGVPNSLYEAMAAGAFPVVSPLDTVRNVVAEERNVLFARNLYPQEIADALVRAMTDDELVDTAAAENLELVKRIASRKEIRARVLNFYEELCR
jgi:hypothetical protein